MFEEGVKFVDAHNWPDAADRFRRALALRDSQVIRHNLATALLRQGLLVEASELFRQVLRDPSVDAKVHEEAQRELDALTPRIAKLTIQLEGEPAGTEITVDDRPVADVQVGLAMPMDPGVHVVRAKRDDQELDTQEVSIAEGAEETVTLRLVPPTLVATPEQAAATVSPARSLSQPSVATKEDQDPHDRQRAKRLWWGIGSAAVVTVAIVVVSVVVASRSDHTKRYDGDFNPGSLSVEVPR